MWEAGDDAPYDVLIEPGGSLLVGTGTDGKIFRISGDPARATLVARAAARQVTALLREPTGRIIGATSNPGKLLALGADSARRGTYESDVRDAGTTATLGRHPVAGGRKAGPGPDRHSQREHRYARRDLEPWSAVYATPTASRSTSPNARYLQWRAVLRATPRARRP